MTHLAGRSKPSVALASPVSQPPRARHASSRRGPAARWIAPSTPLPPSSDELAALTIASTSMDVMSACTVMTFIGRGSQDPLHQHDVEPLAELPADLALLADDLEPGAEMEVDRHLVAPGDLGH